MILMSRITSQIPEETPPHTYILKWLYGHVATFLQTQRGD